MLYFVGIISRVYFPKFANTHTQDWGGVMDNGTESKMANQIQVTG